MRWRERALHPGTSVRPLELVGQQDRRPGQHLRQPLLDRDVAQAGALRLEVETIPIRRIEALVEPHGSLVGCELDMKFPPFMQTGSLIRSAR